MTIKYELVNLYKYGAKYGKTHKDGTTVRKGKNRALGGLKNVRTFLDKDDNVIKYVHKFKDGLGYVTVINATPTETPGLFDIIETNYEKHTNYNAIIQSNYIGKLVKDFVFGLNWETVITNPEKTTIERFPKLV